MTNEVVEQEKIKGMNFINRVLTKTNPRDAYYYNKEEYEKQYYIIILIGCFLVFYMLIS